MVSSNIFQFDENLKEVPVVNNDKKNPRTELSPHTALSSQMKQGLLEQVQEMFVH